MPHLPESIKSRKTQNRVYVFALVFMHMCVCVLHDLYMEFHVRSIKVFLFFCCVCSVFIFLSLHLVLFIIFCFCFDSNRWFRLKSLVHNGIIGSCVSTRIIISYLFDLFFFANRDKINLIDAVQRCIVMKICFHKINAVYLLLTAISWPAVVDIIHNNVHFRVYVNKCVSTGVIVNALY